MVGCICVVKTESPSLKSLREESRPVLSASCKRDGIYLFLSFDLANATEYKIRNSNWHKTFQDFYADITKRVADDSSPIKNSKIWKFIGDEVLFYLKVTNKEELFKSLPYIWKITKDVEERLKVESHYFDKLHIKTTVWLADVADGIPETPNHKAVSTIFTPPYENYNSRFPQKPDFLGFEIDLGFRISKYSRRGVIAIDAKMAYLLYKNRQLLKDDWHNKKVDEAIKITSYESLKGIWRNHKYPIIWYSADWNVDTLFLYDEHFDNSNVLELKTKIKESKLDSISKLEKIFKDMNQKDDIDEILNKINDTSIEEENEINLDKVSEVHVALICFNPAKDKILSVHRSASKKRFPNMWEFGCGQVKPNESFEDTVRRTYRDDFGIEIEVMNNAAPVATYSFNNGNQTVPGLILLGKSETESVTLNGGHDEYKWLTKDDINNICDDGETQYVESFKENALKAFELL